MSTVRHACVQKDSTELNVTSGAPATWKTHTGEARLPLQGSVHYLEREIGREIPTLRPFQPLGHPGQEPLSKWKTFVLGGGGGRMEQVNSVTIVRWLWVDIRFYSLLMATSKD